MKIYHFCKQDKACNTLYHREFSPLLFDWDTQLKIEMKGGDFIGLLIKEVNSEYVIVNEDLTDIELTRGFYISEFYRLRDKAILLNLEISKDVIQFETDDFVYVIKEEFNGTKELRDIVGNLILKENKT